MSKESMLVIGEHNYGEIHHVTYEMLGKAIELATGKDMRVECLIAGPRGLDVNEICYRGAEKVHYMVHECFTQADEQLYKDNLVEAIRKIKPSLVLIGATAFGRSLAPRIAGALNTGLTADCTDLKLGEDGRILQVRPAFSDNILAHIKTVRDPQMATIRYKEFNEAPRNDRSAICIEEMEPFVTVNPDIQILDHEPLGSEDITKAGIIVACGRGFKKKEDLRMAEELAEAIGGTLAVSRALVDAGIASGHIQVGYSGHRVKPSVYIALGISGAPQHIAGMKESGRIIAVNSDSSAPIFGYADIGYVGDIYEIVPKLTEYCQARKSK